MIRFNLLVTFFLITQYSHGQDPHFIDSLKKKLTLLSEDTERVETLGALAYEFYDRKPEESRKYAQEGLELAKRIKFKKGEILSLNRLSLSMFTVGNYANALQLLLQALQESELIGWEQGISTSLLNIGEIYSVLDDHMRSIVYAKKSLAVAQKNNQKKIELTNYANLGEYFEKFGQPDSALIYENKAFQLNRELNNVDMEQVILYNLGKIYTSLNEDDLALSYFKKSLLLFPKTGDHTYSSKALFALGGIFERSSQKDSALNCYRSAFKIARESQDLLLMLNTTKQLANLYEAINKDSVLNYLKLSTGYRDSLLNQQKLRQIQNLTFSEQQRQQENELRSTQEKATRKLNIEYFSIGVGILLFITLFLILSRSIIVNEKWLSFLGILGLLLVFEFINLFIHPSLSTITHESPLLMLLVMVGIASILIPVHHRLEQWIKVRLVEKNRLIRLRNAERTIADLRGKVR